MNALPICDPASMNATIQMLTDRPTSIEKPANTRPPSSAMRTRLPRSATFAIGTDSASAAPNASTNGMVTPAMPTPKSSAMVGAVTENEMRATSSIALRPKRMSSGLTGPVAGEPVEPANRVTKRVGGARGTRARPTPAAATSGSRRTSPHRRGHIFVDARPVSRGRARPRPARRRWRRRRGGSARRSPCGARAGAARGHGRGRTRRSARRGAGAARRARRCPTPRAATGR